MYQKILFAVDFDEVSLKVCQKANEIAKQYGAELHVVHVIEPVPTYAYPGFVGFADVEEEINKQAKQALGKVQKDLELDEEHMHLEQGSIKHEVTELAQKIGADLIVVGSHSRHGFARILGSTANAILNTAKGDVLIVRQAD
jgi:universal stress protein A